MQEYMRLFGSGINFYGGPGESAHKHFIKIPGQRTQHRVSEFAQQTALQYYNMLVSGYAGQDCLIELNHYKHSGESEIKLDITQGVVHANVGQKLLFCDKIKSFLFD